MQVMHEKILSKVTLLKILDNKSYLEVNFDKDLLIEVFKELSIPVLSNSRPVILFLIEIDSGT